MFARIVRRAPCATLASGDSSHHERGVQEPLRGPLRNLGWRIWYLRMGGLLHLLQHASDRERRPVRPDAPPRAVGRGRAPADPRLGGPHQQPQRPRRLSPGAHRQLHHRARPSRVDGHVEHQRQAPPPGPRHHPLAGRLVPARPGGCRFPGDRPAHPGQGPHAGGRERDGRVGDHHRARPKRHRRRRGGEESRRRRRVRVRPGALRRPVLALDVRVGILRRRSSHRRRRGGSVGILQHPPRVPRAPRPPRVFERRRPSLLRAAGVQTARGRVHHGVGHHRRRVTRARRSRRHRLHGREPGRERPREQGRGWGVAQDVRHAPGVHLFAPLRRE